MAEGGFAAVRRMLTGSDGGDEPETTHSAQEEADEDPKKKKGYFTRGGPGYREQIDDLMRDLPGGDARKDKSRY